MINLLYEQLTFCKKNQKVHIGTCPALKRKKAEMARQIDSFNLSWLSPLAKTRAFRLMYFCHEVFDLLFSLYAHILSFPSLYETQVQRFGRKDQPLLSGNYPSARRARARASLSGGGGEAGWRREPVGEAESN